VDALEPAVIEEARHSHPHVSENGARAESGSYRGIEGLGRPLDAPLPPPPAYARQLEFRLETLSAGPLAGRIRPEIDQASGHGLWLVNQLCDLVQVRTSEHGTVVRAHTRRG
jgi:hypothetical protein